MRAREDQCLPGYRASLGRVQALSQDRVKIGDCEIRVGLEELVGGIEGPVVVIDDLVVQFTLIIKGADVVSSGQTVA